MSWYLKLTQRACVDFLRLDAAGMGHEAKRRTGERSRSQYKGRQMPVVFVRLHCSAIACIWQPTYQKLARDHINDS